MLSSVTEVSPMTALRQRMLEDLRIRNYAPTTVACYIRSVAEFAQHFNKPPDQGGANLPLGDTHSQFIRAHVE
jgi:hypothetical protein